jgi:hypothetical protein
VKVCVLVGVNVKVRVGLLVCDGVKVNVGVNDGVKVGV